MTSYAVAFAGNPGREYERTRHNIGWMLIPYLHCAGKALWKEKFKGMYSQVQCGSKTLCLLKPHTFMNKIGESVQPCLSFFKLESDQLIVIHDDLELPFGEAALKAGGGLGGHNGLRSVAQSIGTQQFYRLRIGVGRPPRGDVSAYVLSRFSEEEEAELPDVLERAAAVLEGFIVN
jgi:PTH1 family peptidyl-tRNA hydrolase